MTRQLVVVDCETTSLDTSRAAILEIAAVNVATGEELCFVPHVDQLQLASATPEAMQINRYYERGVWRNRLGPSATAAAFEQLSEMLHGNTFGGSNPRFDAAMVERQKIRDEDGGPHGERIGKVWHHRLADLAAYAGPALLLAPNELVGLAQICERLGVQIDGEHTALGDARATAECFRKLTHYYAHNLDSLP